MVVSRKKSETGTSKKRKPVRNKELPQQEQNVEETESEHAEHSSAKVEDLHGNSKNNSDLHDRSIDGLRNVPADMTDNVGNHSSFISEQGLDQTNEIKSKQNSISQAEMHLMKMPVINDEGKPMAVWTDIKEIIFPSCSDSRCDIVLNVIKEILEYPQQEKDASPCTPKQQMAFLRNFRIVPCGTLLVNTRTIQDKIQTLKSMVRTRHVTSEEVHSKECHYAKEHTSHDNILSPDHRINTEFQQMKSVANNHFCWCVLPLNQIKDISKAGGEFDPIVYNGRYLIPAMKFSSRPYVPMSLIHPYFREFYSYLFDLSRDYLVGTGTEITRCLSPLEANCVSSYIARQQGWGSRWRHITSRDLLIDWQKLCKHVKNPPPMITTGSPDLSNNVAMVTPLQILYNTENDHPHYTMPSYTYSRKDHAWMNSGMQKIILPSNPKQVSILKSNETAKRLDSKSCTNLPKQIGIESRQPGIPIQYPSYSSDVNECSISTENTRKLQPRSAVPTTNNSTQICPVSYYCFKSLGDCLMQDKTGSPKSQHNQSKTLQVHQAVVNSRCQTVGGQFSCNGNMVNKTCDVSNGTYKNSKQKNRAVDKNLTGPNKFSNIQGTIIGHDSNGNKVVVINQAVNDTGINRKQGNISSMQTGTHLNDNNPEHFVVITTKNIVSASQPSNQIIIVKGRQTDILIKEHDQMDRTKKETGQTIDQKEPYQTNGQKKEVGQSSDRKEELFKTISQKEEPCQTNGQQEKPYQTNSQKELTQTNGQKEEPYPTNSQKEEPIHTNGQKEEPIHTNGQKEEPIHTNDQKEELSQTNAQKEEPCQTNGQQEKPYQMNGQKEESFPTNGQKEEPIHTNCQKEKSCQTNGQKEASQTNGQKEKPSHTNSQNEEASQKNGQKEEPYKTKGQKKEPIQTNGQEGKPYQTHGHKEEHFPTNSQKEEPCLTNVKTDLPVDSCWICQYIQKKLETDERSKKQEVNMTKDQQKEQNIIKHEIEETVLKGLQNKANENLNYNQNINSIQHTSLDTEENKIYSKGAVSCADRRQHLSTRQQLEVKEYIKAKKFVNKLKKQNGTKEYLGTEDKTVKSCQLPQRQPKKQHRPMVKDPIINGKSIPLDNSIANANAKLPKYCTLTHSVETGVTKSRSALGVNTSESPKTNNTNEKKISKSILSDSTQFSTKKLPKSQVASATKRAVILPIINASNDKVSNKSKVRSRIIPGQVVDVVGEIIKDSLSSQKRFEKLTCGTAVSKPESISKEAPYREILFETEDRACTRSTNHLMTLASASPFAPNSQHTWKMLNDYDRISVLQKNRVQKIVPVEKSFNKIETFKPRKNRLKGQITLPVISKSCNLLPSQCRNGCVIKPRKSISSPILASEKAKYKVKCDDLKLTFYKIKEKSEENNQEKRSIENSIMKLDKRCSSNLVSGTHSKHLEKSETQRTNPDLIQNKKTNPDKITDQNTGNGRKKGENSTGQRSKSTTKTQGKIIRAKTSTDLVDEENENAIDMKRKAESRKMRKKRGKAAKKLQQKVAKENQLKNNLVNENMNDLNNCFKGRIERLQTSKKVGYSNKLCKDKKYHSPDPKSDMKEKHVESGDPKSGMKEKHVESGDPKSGMKEKHMESVAVDELQGIIDQNWALQGSVFVLNDDQVHGNQRVLRRSLRSVLMPNKQKVVENVDDDDIELVDKKKNSSKRGRRKSRMTTNWKKIADVVITDESSGDSLYDPQLNSGFHRDIITCPSLKDKQLNNLDKEAVCNIPPRNSPMGTENSNDLPDPNITDSETSHKQECRPSSNTILQVGSDTSIYSQDVNGCTSTCYDEEENSLDKDSDEPFEQGTNNIKPLVFKQGNRYIDKDRQTKSLRKYMPTVKDGGQEKSVDRNQHILRTCYMDKVIREQQRILEIIRQKNLPYRQLNGSQSVCRLPGPQDTTGPNTFNEDNDESKQPDGIETIVSVNIEIEDPSACNDQLYQISYNECFEHSHLLDQGEMYYHKDNSTTANNTNMKSGYMDDTEYNHNGFIVNNNVPVGKRNLEERRNTELSDVNNNDYKDKTDRQNHIYQVQSNHNIQMHLSELHSVHASQTHLSELHSDHASETYLSDLESDHASQTHLSDLQCDRASQTHLSGVQSYNASQTHLSDSQTKIESDEYFNDQDVVYVITDDHDNEYQIQIWDEDQTNNNITERCKETENKNRNVFDWIQTKLLGNNCDDDNVKSPVNVYIQTENVISQKDGNMYKLEHIAEKSKSSVSQSDRNVFEWAAGHLNEYQVLNIIPSGKMGNSDEGQYGTTVNNEIIISPEEVVISQSGTSNNDLSQSETMSASSNFDRDFIRDFSDLDENDVTLTQMTDFGISTDVGEDDPSELKTVCKCKNADLNEVTNMYEGDLKSMSEVTIPAIGGDSNTSTVTGYPIGTDSNLSCMTVSSEGVSDMRIPDIGGSQTTSGYDSANYNTLESDSDLTLSSVPSVDAVKDWTNHILFAMTTNPVLDQQIVTDAFGIRHIPEYDKLGETNSGIIFLDNWIIPYVSVNGYKYVTLKDALLLFSSQCQPKCQIPKNVLKKHPVVFKTFCSWEQVYLLDQLLRGPQHQTVQTGEMLLRFDTVVSNMTSIKDVIKDKHRSTKLKNSQNCQYSSC